MAQGLISEACKSYGRRRFVSPAAPAAAGDAGGLLRPEGIQASKSLEGFECWSYKPSLFVPVDGGVDRQCQGQDGRLGIRKMMDFYGFHRQNHGFALRF